VSLTCLPLSLVLIKRSSRCVRCCNELFPDLPSRVLGQIAVSQHNMDSAKDCYTNSATRSVVRNMIPSQYSCLRRNTEARLLRIRFSDVRYSRKTSASSKRRMSFQWLAILKMRESCASSLAASVDSSPAQI